MSLYRSMGRGSWIVERTLLGVHVRCATGCYERERAAEVEQTLLKLAKHGRRDLIAAFDASRVTGPELIASVEQFGVSFQLTVESAVKLRRAVYEWLRDVDLAEKTRKEYRVGLGQLLGRLPLLKQRKPTETEQRFLACGPSLHELPILVAHYARRRTTKAAMFVQVKAAAQSFVHSTQPKGQHSDLWRDVAVIQGPPRKGRDVQGGLTPELARTVAERLGRLGPMWWTMCCTGMGNKEYWHARGWEVFPSHIAIHGTKDARHGGNRDRIVPWITTPVRALCGYQKFGKALKAVGIELYIKKPLTPYVARRTYAHWLELAKIDDSHCDALMGHSPGSKSKAKMRGLYREHDILPYLPAITEKLRAAIGSEPRYMEILA